MPQIFVSKVIPAPIEDVWETIREFDSLADWHPTIRSSVIESGEPGDAVGSVRTIEIDLTDDDQVLQGRLVEHSDINHYYKYESVDNPIPWENYLAEVRLTAITDQRQTLGQWSSRFDIPKEQKQSVTRELERAYTEGLAGLVDRFST